MPFLPKEGKCTERWYKRMSKALWEHQNWVLKESHRNSPDEKYRTCKGPNKGDKCWVAAVDCVGRGLEGEDGLAGPHGKGSPPFKVCTLFFRQWGDEEEKKFNVLIWHKNSKAKHLYDFKYHIGPLSAKPETLTMTDRESISTTLVMLIILLTADKTFWVSLYALYYVVLHMFSHPIITIPYAEYYY